MDTLNRKYLTQAIDGSLKRMQLDFIDLVFCHRSDPHTPLEETVWAMSDMITRGKALYWGTSEWSRGRHPRRLGHRRQAPPAQAGDGAAAVQPVPSQARRAGVRALYDDIGLGLTTWSPLASGLLTGKYRKGIPRRQPRRAREHVVARQGPDRRSRRTPRSTSSRASPPRSARASARWRSPGRSRTRTSRPSSPARRTSASCAPTCSPSTSCPRLTPEVVARIDEIALPLASLTAAGQRGAALSAASCSGVPTFSQRPR